MDKVIRPVEFITYVIFMLMMLCSYALFLMVFTWALGLLVSEGLSFRESLFMATLVSYVRLGWRDYGLERARISTRRAESEI